jgi:crotonobetainyl-CoA:carnitine CoA-transferase CaiB-like acyl-CoA transferase
MNLVAEAIAGFAAEIAHTSAELGRRVIIDGGQVADRRPFLDLGRPGLRSPNGSCRMVRTADGWIAVNLPRESDVDLVPAWLGREIADDPWSDITKAARQTPWRDLVATARLLGLPVAGVGEVVADSPEAPLHRMGSPGSPRPASQMQVLDLSAMWAGPLCGSILAAVGMAATKVESRIRPDALREASSLFFERLNGAKNHLVLDFADPADLARLGDMLAAADVAITSARPRAFEQLGLSPKGLFARNPRLTWVAISGYGWRGDGADRVAFGDDAAAAGGLVRRTAGGAPRFLGDALADPLTGLAAAAGALKALQHGGGFLVDAALAITAAGVAARGAVKAAA